MALQLKRKNIAEIILDFVSKTATAEIFAAFSCNPDSNGVTPLMMACRDSNSTLALRLLDISTERINDVDYTGLNALSFAIQSGSRSCIEHLISHGVKVSAATYNQA